MTTEVSSQCECSRCGGRHKRIDMIVEWITDHTFVLVCYQCDRGWK